MASEHQSRRDILQFGQMLHERGFIAACDGNLSVRLGKNRFLVTPTGVSKGMMKTSDLVIVDIAGRRLKGRREVTSEIGMHLLIYRLRPDVGGIVHAHPRTAEILRASLLQDIHATNHPTRITREEYTDRFVNPALERLRFYFPDAYNSLKGSDLQKRRRFETNENQQPHSAVR